MHFKVKDLTCSFEIKIVITTNEKSNIKNSVFCGSGSRWMNKDSGRWLYTNYVKKINID